MAIDFPKVIKKFDDYLSRGLSAGMGQRHGMMCIEAAICAALEEPHSDNPSCVNVAVRLYKINLNDLSWSSPTTRAYGLRDLGIAQLGSKGVVDSDKFNSRLVDGHISVLIPALLRELFPDNPTCLEAARQCEVNGGHVGMSAARKSIYRLEDKPTGSSLQVVYMAKQAIASLALERGAAIEVATAVSWAHLATKGQIMGSNKYLLLSAAIALQVLKDLKSPGCEWLDYQGED